MTRPLRLLILNDDVEAAKQLAASLSTDGVVAYSTDDPDEACQLISLLQHDILLIDVGKLICTPVYPLQAFRLAKPDLKIVGISDGRRGDTDLLLDLLGLDAYLHAPVTPEALIISVPEIAERYLMLTLADTLHHERNGRHGRKLQLDPISFTSGRRSPFPQA
jgi:DNA-binding response OmpR family regulator